MSARPVDLVDVVLALATQAAISPPERRRVLLAEVDVRLAQAGDDAELDVLRLEIARMAREAA